MEKSVFDYSKDHHLFIFSQAEKMLDETVVTMMTIQSRGRFQLNLSLGLIIAIVSFLVTSENQRLIFYSFITLIPIVVSFILSAIGIFKYRISTKGTAPKKLINNEIYSKISSIEKIELNVIWNEYQDYQDRIDKNFRVNRCRIWWVTFSSLTLYSVPLFILLAFWIYGK